MRVGRVQHRDGRDTQRIEVRPTTDDFPSPAKYSQSTSRNAITRREKTDKTPYRLPPTLRPSKLPTATGRPTRSQSPFSLRPLNRESLSGERLGEMRAATLAPHMFALSLFPSFPFLPHQPNTLFALEVGGAVEEYIGSTEGGARPYALLMGEECKPAHH